MFKTIIIDKDPSTSEKIRSLMESLESEIEVCKICTSIQESITAIKKYQPDVLFLGTHLADGHGFEVLQALRGIKTRVVFVAPDEHYALQAIKHNAFDYILKPIVPGEVYGVINKAIKDMVATNSSTISTNLLEPVKYQSPKKIAVPNRNGLQYYSMNEIVFIEGQGSYAKIYLSDNSNILVTRLLKDFEISLSHSAFLRVHKSYLINIDHIIALRKEGYLLMSNKIKVPLGTKDKDQVIVELKNCSILI